MLKQLGLVELQRAVQNMVASGTGVACYDVAPAGKKAPLYFVEAVGKRAENTKTMFCDVFTLYVHCIAAQGKGHADIYGMIQAAEEALTTEISLSEDFTLLRQTEVGLVHIKQDESREMHAVLAYEIKICYGFATKN